VGRHLVGSASAGELEPRGGVSALDADQYRDVTFRFALGPLHGAASGVRGAGPLACVHSIARAGQARRTVRIRPSGQTLCSA